jgi:adenosylhomocysteine nucleosidase
MNLRPGSRIAIIAALPGELKPLVRDWQRIEPNLWTGHIAGHEAIAIAGGMGAAGATRAVGRAFAQGKPDVLISYGWAGALTCALKPPGAYAISEVIDDLTGERFATRSDGGIRLITLDHVAHVHEKRSLAEKHQAVLVDMEAAAVARLAVASNIAFCCFKGISDGYTDHLPDFSRFIQTGQLRMPAFLTYAAVHPVYWRALARLGKNSGIAASNLARLLSKSQLQSRNL